MRVRYSGAWTSSLSFAGSGATPPASGNPPPLPRFKPHPHPAAPFLPLKPKRPTRRRSPFPNMAISPIVPSAPSRVQTCPNHSATTAWSPMTFRSEEHTSELQSLMRISYAVFCLKKKNKHKNNHIAHVYENLQIEEIEH